MNYQSIIEGFMAKGIEPQDIKPRENVFTFNAWLELGRAVRRGEHGVKILTFIPVTDKETGEVIGTRPKSTTVFHLSQTEEAKKRAA